MAVDNRPDEGSFLHRMDPRTKLLLILLFTVLVFIVDSLYLAVIQMLFFVAICLSARIPIRKIFTHYRFLLFLVVLVLILQMLFGQETPGCRYLVHPLIPEWFPLLGGMGSLKLDGLFTGLMISCRIIALTVLLPALTMTTEARLLAYGITRLGINYWAAHIITSTLNLIPSFEEETRLIMDARKLRGVVSFEKGNLFSRLKEYPALALPLMIKAMRKALMVGLAMDARAFGAYKTRTWLLSARMSAIDIAAFAAGTAYSVIIITANCMLKR